MSEVPLCRCRAKREQLETFKVLVPHSRGQNLALTVLCVPSWLDSGARMTLDRWMTLDRHVQGYLAHKK